MKKVLPLLLTTAALASVGPPTFACPMPPLPALVQMSDYVALVRVVGQRDVRDVRVTEYEVTRAFKGTPPTRFVMITQTWEREEEAEPADVPQATGSAIVFLTTDPVVQAPWKDWDTLARATNGLAVLDAITAEPVLLWRGVVGVADPETEMLMNAIIQAVDPDAPMAHGVLPLESYFEKLAAAVEEAARTPPPAAEDEEPAPR